MKKARLLVVFIAVALMIMGAGYSLWNQVVTPQSFPMDTVGVELVNVTPIDGTSGLKVTSSDFNKTSAHIHLDNIGPQSHVTYEFTVMNTGEVPIVFRGIEIPGDQDLGAFSSGVSLYFNELGITKSANVDSTNLYNVTIPSLGTYTFHVTYQFFDLNDIPQANDGRLMIYFHYQQA